MKLLSLSIPVDIARNTESISATLLDGKTSIPLSITDDHPNWSNARKLVEDFRNGLVPAEELADALFNAIDLKSVVEERFVRVGGILDGRMSISGGHVTVDYEPVDSTLESHILRMLEQDGSPKNASNWRAFARFIENLYANTDSYVREQLFSWMSYENLHGHGLTLTEDGCLIGYKGTEGTTEAPLSIRSGHAIVNGVSMNGQVPNKLGSIIEMPRNEVEANPAVGCAPGLHVGTYNYAEGWSRGVLLTVKFNPRDVVSVPVDCAAQKIRVCRYEVLESITKAYESVTFSGKSATPGDPVSLAILDTLNEALADDSKVKIEYKSNSGEITYRVITVVEVDGNSVQAFCETAQAPRTFLIRNICAADLVEEETDSYSEDSEDGECGLEDECCNCDCEVSQELAEDVLQEIIEKGEDLILDYESVTGFRSTRVITPEKINGEGGTARLYALCHTSGEFRSFLIGNIVSITLQKKEDAEIDEEVSRNGYTDSKDPWA
jgi:predicted DNA-binding transcriptional regulator YafY